MMPEKITFLTAGISAFGAIVGVVIGSIVSFLIAKQQFKATVISANRQQWINNLRDCIAEFQNRAKIALVETRLAFNNKTSIAANEKSHYEALKGIHFLVNKVALLINPLEKDHSELLLLFKELEYHCVNGDPSDQTIEESLQEKITSTGQIILKREWERVKRGK